ncbi:hypothetical protein QMO56_09205 [Roseomonas sp. E05]|uniref:hypothetical protein n=1 Tax=Roseomonas sp. E05 TaxID=3046310 RepID=UPI0024BB125C|nr:hypothetical protein [Roseomonas sp. E05]MDJ0388290.1 hypothetical protein [Roseomonas sp. E05]
MPALMSGYGSVMDRTGMADFARAAWSLRQLGVSVASDIQLRQAVLDAVTWEADARAERDDFRELPFEIDAEHRRHRFRLREGAEAEADRMAEILHAGLGLEGWGVPTADPARPMAVMEAASEGAERIQIDLADLPAPPPAPRHDFGAAPRGPISVPLDELEDVARAMDAADAAAPERPRGNWLGRLRGNAGPNFQILAPDRAAGALPATREIRLEGLKHLIGLPGTGKSTLIILLIMWLDRRGLRTVVLLPSIESSLNLLADLRFYGADVGLLVGQSPETRIGHARKLAERLGSDDNRGFGRSAPGADLLGLNCALGGFDTDPEGHDGFPHLAPPCTAVLQRRLKRDGAPQGRETAHLCPLSGCCGRMKAPRELTSRRVWLGHVLSLDTRVSPHFSEERLRYFEAAAMAADVVIVDEADGAQQALDRKALSSLDLTGSRESYEHHLVRDLFSPVAAGRNDITATNVQNYTAAANDFGRLNRSLVTHLQEDRRINGGEGPISRFRDTFVTSHNVLTALFAPADYTVLPDADRLAEDLRHTAIQDLWDACVRSALYRRTDRDEDVSEYEFELDRVAAGLARTPEEVSSAARAVTDRIRSWISEPLPTRREALLKDMRERFFVLVPPADGLAAGQAAELFRFLLGVTGVILQFLTLVPAQQAMVAEGIHREPLFRQGISDDLASSVPEALIGRLAGLSFNFDESGPRPSLRLRYVSFRGAPRILLYRLHELLRHERGGRGPAVLLASATSFLLESPTFHIPVGPDLVLRREDSGEAWRRSSYRFAPIPDPQDPSRFLRFSGAPMAQRERMLRAMVDHYAAGHPSLLERMARDFDGGGRKVALVVSSYEQVRIVKDWLRRRYPSLAPRVVGVAPEIPERSEGDWVTAAQVERLGLRDDWDALVFPMKSLSRGVNIVFERGPRRRDALIGTMIFLIRPHPATESLDLVAGMSGATSLAFDVRAFPHGAGNGSVSAEWALARRDAMRTARRLLRFPLMASRLGPLATPFTADIMVDVLQTIGRSMRNGCPSRVIFADAAWAPVSAGGRGRDKAASSMLVAMRDILRARLSDPNAVDREIYRALYEPFLYPLERCEGVSFPDGADASDE